MKQLRHFCLGILMALALSIPTFAGEMSCPGVSAGTQESPGVTGVAESPGITGEMSTPGAAGQIPTPGVAG